MKQYTHLFFDLDGTLWDLKTNTRNALEHLFTQYHSQLKGIAFESFFHRYHFHNDQVWALYRENKIEKEVLRTIRFERAFADHNLHPGGEFITEFADSFLDICPRQPKTLDGAHDLLNYLRDKECYHMHIITNGFIEVQGIKMEAAGITNYFKEIINSEHCGVRKPQPGIFQYALQKTGATLENSLMIGDDWEADILGARNFGMDQAFITTTEEMLNDSLNAYGHNPIRHNYQPTYTISNLTELMEVL